MSQRNPHGKKEIESTPSNLCLSLTAQRIKARRDELGWSQETLAKRIGVTRAAISYWETGATKSLTGDNLFRVARALGAEPEWLMGGANAPTPVGEEQPSEELVAIVRFAGGSPGTNPSEVLMLPHTLVRLMGLDPAAPDNACFVLAEGDSMSPSTPNGSIVIVNTSRRELRHGKVFAFLVSGDVRLRRAFKPLSGEGWRLSADNDNKRVYPDETIPTDHTITIIGQCAWRWGEL